MANGSSPAPEATAKATFGAGCFWQVEERFRELDGVLDTAVGYEGGHVDNPTYEQVCRGDTGHVEVVEVAYDPKRVDFEQLVRVYFDLHDPTQLNRQGPDVGWQYRSVVFTDSDEQAETVRRVIETSSPASGSRSSPRSSPRPPSGGPRSTTSATCRSGASRAAC